MDTPIDTRVSNRNNANTHSNQSHSCNYLKKIKNPRASDPYLNIPANEWTDEMRAETTANIIEIQRKSDLEILQKTESVALTARFKNIGIEVGTESLYVESKFTNKSGLYDDQRNVKTLKFMLSGAVDQFKNNPNLRNKGVFLFGNSGIGKSFLLKIHGRNQILSRKTCRLYDYEKLISELVSGQNNYSRTEEYYTLMHQLKSVDILYLDNFNSDVINKRHTGILSELLTERYKKSYFTYFSSDVHPDQLITNLGNTLVNMILDYSIVGHLHGGLDYRRAYPTTF